MTLPNKASPAMPLILRPFKLALAFLLAATTLAPPARAQTDAAKAVTVSGQITYRQRIALAPDSVATVSLRDISLADAPSKVVVDASYTGHQVPIPFELAIAGDLLDPRHSYSVSASIRGADGALLWTTDTVIPVDPTQPQTDVGAIDLTPVAAASASGSEILTGDAWRIEDIDGRGVIDIAQTTIAFDTQGGVSGSGGCNRYNAGYELNGETLNIGGIAATRMACVPAVGAQEQAFFAFLNGPLKLQISETGALVMTNARGQTLTARR